MYRWEGERVRDSHTNRNGLVVNELKDSSRLTRVSKTSLRKVYSVVMRRDQAWKENHLVDLQMWHRERTSRVVRIGPPKVKNNSVVIERRSFDVDWVIFRDVERLSSLLIISNGTEAPRLTYDLKGQTATQVRIKQCKWVDSTSLIDTSYFSPTNFVWCRSVLYILRSVLFYLLFWSGLDSFYLLEVFSTT